MLLLLVLLFFFNEFYSIHFECWLIWKELVYKWIAINQTELEYIYLDWIKIGRILCKVPQDVFCCALTLYKYTEMSWLINIFHANKLQNVVIHFMTDCIWAWKINMSIKAYMEDCILQQYKALWIHHSLYKIVTDQDAEERDERIF